MNQRRDLLVVQAKSEVGGILGAVADHNGANPEAAPQEEKTREIEGVPESLLTVPEAAQRLRVSEYTLRGWISLRRIPYLEIGRRTRFNPADLDNLTKPLPWKLKKPLGRY